MHFALLSLVLACGGGSTIEVVTESHANGTVLAQTSMRHGVPHGESIERYPSGQLFRRTAFVDGVEEGLREE